MLTLRSISNFKYCMFLFSKSSSKDSNISGAPILIFVPRFNLYSIYLLWDLILLLSVLQHFEAVSWTSVTLFSSFVKSDDRRLLYTLLGLLNKRVCTYFCKYSHSYSCHTHLWMKSNVNNYHLSNTLLVSDTLGMTGISVGQHQSLCGS